MKRDERRELCCVVLIGIFGLLISEQKPKTNNPKSQLKRSELQCTPNIWWRMNAFFFSIRLISFFTSLQINRNEKKGVNDEEKDELNQTEQKWMMSEESTHYIHFVLFICLSSFIIQQSLHNVIQLKYNGMNVSEMEAWF